MFGSAVSTTSQHHKELDSMDRVLDRRSCRSNLVEVAVLFPWKWNDDSSEGVRAFPRERNEDKDKEKAVEVCVQIASPSASPSALASCCGDRITAYTMTESRRRSSSEDPLDDDIF